MDNKPLKDYPSEDLLLKYDRVKRLTVEYANWHEPKSIQSKYGELAISTFISWLFDLLATITAWSSLGTIFQGVSVVVLGGLLLYCIYATIKWYDASQKIKDKPALKIDEMLLSSSKEAMRYTGIIRIVYKTKKQIIYLTGSDYFLPHCNLKTDAAINQQDDVIKHSLSDFDIHENDIVSIQPVDNKMYHSIKPIHGTIQMNAFVFYDVHVKIQIKEKLIQPNTKRRWISIEDMRRNSQAMSTNKDVIELLESFPPCRVLCEFVR